MHFITVCRLKVCFLTITMVGLCVQAVCATSVVQAETNVSAYEIPTSELNKVKKKAPSKRTSSESKKKKKTEITATKASENISPSKSDRQAKIPPVDRDTAHDATVPKTPAATGTAANPEHIQIHHTPYSFVVPEKMTTIHAVINSRKEIQEVYCTLPAAGGVAQTQVKMEKMVGTQFTYSTRLPGVPSDKTDLRYTIVFVDALGTVTRSQEFVTPVTSSPVVPGWQLEGTNAAAVVDEKIEQKADQKKE